MPLTSALKEGVEIPEEELAPATYDDLLSYYNQSHHQVINRITQAFPAAVERFGHRIPRQPLLQQL
jgi:hypothetical protein